MHITNIRNHNAFVSRLKTQEGTKLKSIELVMGYIPLWNMIYMTFLHSDAEISRDGLRDMVETVALVSCTLSQLYALRFVKVCEGL